MAAGYHNAPELTADRFAIKSFASERVYRTGDIVIRLVSGEFVFIRRIDDQVKIAGFRIELQEIEVVFCKHPKVKPHIYDAIFISLIRYFWVTVRSKKLLL